MELTKVNNHYEDSEGNKYKIIPVLFKINKDGTEERQYGIITLDIGGEKTGYIDLKELGERNNRLL